MRGTILGLHDGRGVLLSADERRLEFPLSEWRSAGAPSPGQIVDFVEEGGQARAVFIVPGAHGPSGVGVRHSGSFVLGAISVGCLALGFVIPFLPTVAAYVLGVVGAAQARAEPDDTALMLSRIGWIGGLVMLSLVMIILFIVFAFIGTVGFAALWHGGVWDF
jgi:hypothetical protein